MILSERLKKIAGMVEDCDSIADIGTDHGYIPIYLVQNEICKHAIASDINKGPVDKAIKNIKFEGLENKIECRLGPGLKTIKPHEVEAVVIAGMGGHLINEILDEGQDVIRDLSFAVLQPVQHAEILRKHLYLNGYSILDEELCFDEGKYYEIIKVKRGMSFTVVKDIYYEISEILIKKKHPLLKAYINFKIDKNSNILESLKEDSDSVRKRKEELLERNTQLKEILLCL